jgi:hypothetical protein
MATLNLQIEESDQKLIDKYREIFLALLKVGGLSGVRNGKTIIHFNHEGDFMGVQLDYWPYKRRKTE